MANTLIETVEFRATAPKRALPGLDEAVRKLEALAHGLDAVNQRLSGVSTHSAFRRTARTIEEEIKRLETRKGRGQTLGTIGRALGYDARQIRDMRQFILRNEEELTRQIEASERKRAKLRGAANAGARAEMRGNEKRMQAERAALQNTFRGPQMRMQSAPAAARVIAEWQKTAVQAAKEPVDMLRTLLGQGVAAGAVQLPPGTRITPPPVGKDPGPDKKRRGQSGGPGRSPLPPAAAGPGTLLEERVSEAGGTQRVRRRYLESVGKQFEEFFKDAEKIGTAQVSSPLQKKRAEFNRKFAEIRRQIDEQIAAPGARGSRADVARLRLKAAKEAEALIAGKPGQELEKLGLGGLADRAKSFSARQRATAQRELDRAVAAGTQAQLAHEQKTTRAYQKLAAQPSIEEQQRADHAKARQKANTSLNQFYKTQDAAAQQAKRRQERVSSLDTKRAQAAAYRTATTTAAQQALNDFLASGGQVVSTRAAFKGAPGRVVAQKAEGGFVKTLDVSYGKAGASANLTTKAVRELRQEVGLLSGDFVKNTLKVTTWAASVGVLYGAIGLVKAGFASTLEIGAQMARLDQVFTKIGGSTQDLTRDVLGLAAVYGRSSDEAMAAAIQWSRMGLSRIQVQEAVRVSLMAANVAELSAAEATDHLQAIMRNFGLQVGDLRAKLGELNEMSNTYNVTNKDMLEGVSRSAAVAKQAGLPFEELAGLIGATVGATKQSGSQVGNAMKTFMLSLSNPGVQDTLRTGFGFEMTTGGEQIKDMSRALADFYVHYQKLTQLEQQAELFKVAGKFQANRVAAMLDNYVRGQLLALNAQLNLNSAQEENEKILGTLKAQLAGLNTEWQKFVAVQADAPVKGLVEMSKALRGVLALMNTPAGSAVTTGLLGLGAAASAKVLMTGLALRDNRGFLGRTGGRIATSAVRVNEIINSGVLRHVGAGAPGRGIGPMPFVPAQLGLMDKLVYKTNLMAEAALRAGRSMRAAGTAGASFFTAFGVGAKAVTAATMAVREFMVPLLVVMAGVKGFNLAMEGLGVTSDRMTSRVQLLTDRAREANAAAGAMAQTVRLMQTAQKAFTQESIERFPADQAQLLLSGVAEAAFADEKDLAVKQRKTKELQDQLGLLFRQRDAVALQARLSQLIEDRQVRRREEAEREVSAMAEAIGVRRAELSRLSRADTGFWSFLGRKGRNENRQNIRAEMAELEGRSRARLLDVTEEQTQEDQLRLEYSLKHLGALEQQKQVLEGIAAIYDQIRTTTPLDKSVVQSAKLSAQIMADTLRLKTVQEALRTEGAPPAERLAKVRELEEQLATLTSARARAQGELTRRTDVAVGRARDPREGNARGFVQKGMENLYTAGGMFVPGFEHPLNERVREQEEAFNRLVEQQTAVRKKIALARAGRLPGMGGRDDIVSLEDQSRQLQQRIMARQAEENANRETRELSRRQTLFGMGRDEVSRGATAVSAGANETEKLLREQAYLQERINTLKAAANKNEFEHGQLIEATTRQNEIGLTLLQRQANVQREINQLQIDSNKELMKSFFTAGPAEMLRKLAAFRTAYRTDGQRRPDLSQGAFFGMSPGMRQDYGGFNPQFNPEMVALKQEQARLAAALKEKGVSGGPGGMSGGEAASLVERMAEALKQSLTGLDARLLEALPTGALKSAGEVLDRAAGKLDEVADRLLSAIPSEDVKTTINRLFPKLPQMGGVGGGMGF